MALLGGAGRLLRAAPRRRPAGPPLRGDRRQLPQPLRHRPRRRLHRHRLFPARRRHRARRPLAGAARMRLPARRARAATLARRAVLEVDGLRKTFGGLVAVDDLSFTVGAGEIVGLIGPNGSGKTTVAQPDLRRAQARRRRDPSSRASRSPACRPIRSPGSASPAPSSSCACSTTCTAATMSSPASPSGPTRCGARRRASAPSALLDRVGLAARADVPAGAAHLYRPEAAGARARAGARPAAAPARRVAGRAQPERTRDRHRADPLAARGGPDHRPGRACDGRDPLALRPLRGDERRPQDRRRPAGAPCSPTAR